MKKRIALITALCLTLVSIPALSEAPPTAIPGYTLRESSDELIVYAIRSLKANIVGYLTPNDANDVHVLSVEGEWCYISFPSTYGTGYGYVPLSYFDLAATPTNAPSTDTQPAIQGGTPAWVINTAEGYRLNLRAEPVATSKSLGKYFTGTPVILTGNVTNGYAQVLLAGSTFGWLDERFITLDALGFVPETPMVTISNPGSGAALRSGPGSNYDRIGWYPHGETVTVLGIRSDGWYHVQAGDIYGFISSTLLSGQFSFDHGMDSDNPALADTTAQQTQTMYINTRTSGGQLHLRKSATVSAKSLGLFCTGTPVNVLSYTRDGWAYVQIGHTEGYMDADYLTSTQPTHYGVKRSVRNSRANGLNLRALPSTGGELLTFAPNYEAITVLGELSDGWCYVDYNGTIGYMLGTYLK